MKRITTILILALSLSIGVKAQWYKLQPYTNTLSGNAWVAQSTYPVYPLVAGNGVIVYGIWGQTSSSLDDLAIVESRDDLDHVYKTCTVTTLGFQALAVKNDSTFCFVDFAYPQTYLFYTSNNLTTVSNSTNLNMRQYTGTVPIGFSPNFIYMAWENITYDSTYDSTYVFSDSLLIVRTNPSTLRVDTMYLTNTYNLPITMHFTSDSTGYLSCAYLADTAKKVLLKTADSGKTWTNSFLDSVNAITDFCFSSPNIGYLTESNGAIYKTNNAGATWSKITGPVINRLNCVSFANDSLGYVGGSSGALYETTNAGISWNTITSGTTNNIIALYTFGTIAYFKDDTNGLYKNISPMGVENINATNASVSVYPNPSKSVFNFVINGNELITGNQTRLYIYNMLGEQIFSQPIKNSQFNIELSNQPSGVYFYRITNADKALVASGKLEVQH